MLKRMFRTSPSRTTYVLPSRRWRPAPRRLGVRAGLDQVVPVDHLAADEAAGDVGVDRLGRVERGLAPAQRPGTRLLVARGEERDQVERVAQAARDLLERRGAAVAKRRRLLVVELGQLGLEREVDPAGPVLDREQRLRRQRLELRRQLARVFRERRAAVDVREYLPQLLDLHAQLRLTRLRLLLDPFEPPLDVVAVGHEQLQLQVLQVSRRVGSLRMPSSTTSSASTCLRLPSIAGPVPGTSCTRIAAGVTFRADTTLARASSRASATWAMPTFVLPYSPPPVFVSAVKSVVFPAPGRPTIPTSSATPSAYWSERQRRLNRKRSP